MSQSTPESGDGTMGNARPDLLAGQHFPPPPQQERSRRKRDALLEAALALFAERGYEGTSIEEIAHHAGVAVGGFYQHFTSKLQLLLTLMNRLLEEAAALPQFPPESLQDPRAVIEQIVRQGLLLDWSYVGAYRAWREAVVQDRELQALHLRIEAWTAKLIEMLLRMLYQGPGIRDNVDLVTLASIVSLLFWRLAEVPLNEPDAVIASLTDLIYHALFV